MESAATVSVLFLEESIQAFRSMKKLADRAMAQLDDSRFYIMPDPLSNSIEIMIGHMYGNMISRWTDFLTSDGEKATRDRDGEFEAKGLPRAELLALWEEGWAVLFSALEALQPEDLLRTVTIRGEPHTVIGAVQRQVSHYAYHVGQIVYLAKHLAGDRFQTLSIARGQSKSFNP